MAQPKEYKSKTWRVAMWMFAFDRQVTGRRLRGKALMTEWLKWHPITHASYYQRAKWALAAVRAAERHGE